MRDRLTDYAVRVANTGLLFYYYARWFITRKRPEEW